MKEDNLNLMSGYWTSFLNCRKTECGDILMEKKLLHTPSGIIITIATPLEGNELKKIKRPEGFTVSLDTSFTDDEWKEIKKQLEKIK